MRRIGWVLMWILGLYLIGRAIVEPFVIDLGDPATYRADWGGPSLAGVLTVHLRARTDCRGGDGDLAGSPTQECVGVPADLMAR